MRLAKFQNFQEGNKEGNNLLLARRVGKQLVKAGFTQYKPAFDGLHAAFHGVVVAPDITQAEIHLSGFGRRAVLHTQKRFPQGFQRESIQFEGGRRQGIFFGKLAKNLQRAFFKCGHVFSAFLELLVGDQAGNKRLLGILLFLLGRLGKKMTAFDFHQRSRHGDELTGFVHIEILGIADDFDVLLGDIADEDLLQVNFGFADQRQQQIQRSVKLFEMKAQRHQFNPAIIRSRLSTAFSTASKAVPRMRENAPEKHRTNSKSRVA